MERAVCGKLYVWTFLVWLCSPYNFSLRYFFFYLVVSSARNRKRKSNICRDNESVCVCAPFHFFFSLLYKHMKHAPVLFFDDGFLPIHHHPHSIVHPYLLALVCNVSSASLLILRFPLSSSVFCPLLQKLEREPNRANPSWNWYCFVWWIFETRHCTNDSSLDFPNAGHGRICSIFQPSACHIARGRSTIAYRLRMWTASS